MRERNPEWSGISLAFDFAQAERSEVFKTNYPNLRSA